MIFRKLGLINKNQKGFTMLEMMIAFGLTGIIATGITTTFYQVIVGSVRTSNHMTAIRQAQNAGFWITRDAASAQSIMYDDPDTPGVTEFLTLTWTDWDDTENTVRYTLEDEVKETVTITYLWRDHNGYRIQVAQCIDYNPENFDFDPDNPELTSRTSVDTNGDGAPDTLVLRVSVVVGSGAQAQRETKEYRIISRAA